MKPPKGLRVIPVAEPFLGDEELKNVVEAVKSGWISSRGKFVQEFEEGFASYCGARFGVATSSGTASLHLALEALGIGSGDEVIIPTLTFVATANAVIYTGARPVLVDSHPDYWCMDPAKIEQAITPKTKAIIPVHLYGHPCDMDLVTDIAGRHGLYVIEDAAEAHGAEYKGKKAGGFGHISCFSFYGNKVITTGEGGMCLTNDRQLDGRLRSLREQGMSSEKKYWHDVVGFNYRMTNLQAAIGVAQIGRLGQFVAKKREIAGWYNELLAGWEGISLPPEMPWARNVYWMCCILLEPGYGPHPDEVRERLSQAGIETRPLFYPLHTLPPYRDEGEYTIAEDLSSRGINLPSGVKLERADIEFIVAELVRTGIGKG